MDTSQRSLRDSWRDRWRLSSSHFDDAGFQSFHLRHQKSSYYRSKYQNDPVMLQHLKNLEIQNSLPILSVVEKGLLLLDFFQIFGLLWNAAQPWPWPYLWIIYTRSINWLNIDYFSMTVNGALGGKTGNTGISTWGEMDQYCTYAIVYAVFSLLLSSFLLYNHYYQSSYGKLQTNLQQYSIVAGYFLTYIFYLPCLLAVFRLYYCEDQTALITINGIEIMQTTSILSADPNITCLSTEHTLSILISTLCILPMMFYIPYLHYIQINKEIIYAYNKYDHEKYIQLYEILYCWNINCDYLENQMYLFTSFRLPSRYYYCSIFGLKIILLICFLFLRYDLIVQSCMMLIVLSLFILYNTIILGFPYRNKLSNGLFVGLYLLLLMNIIYGFVNTSELSNLFTTISVEFYLLMIIHAIWFLGFIPLGLGYLILIQKGLDWPSLSTILAIYESPIWLVKISIWIMILKEINTLKQINMIVPLEIMHVEEMEYYIQVLFYANQQAKAMHSLFESYLNAQLEELLVIYSTRQPFAIRKYHYWNDAYCDGIGYEQKELVYVNNNNTNGNNGNDNKAIWRKKSDHNNGSNGNGNNNILSPRTTTTTTVRPTSASNHLNTLRRTSIIRSPHTTTTNTTNNTTNDDNTTHHTHKDNIFQHHHHYTLLMNAKKKRILLKLFAYSTLITYISPHNKKHNMKKQNPYHMKFNIKHYDDYVYELLHGSHHPNHGSMSGTSSSGKDSINFKKFQYNNNTNNDNNSDKKKLFDDMMIEEAKIMILKLQERSELALNKHHLAAQHIYEQQKQKLLLQQSAPLPGDTNNGSTIHLPIGTGTIQQYNTTNTNNTTNNTTTNNNNNNTNHTQSMSNLLSYQLTQQHTTPQHQPSISLSQQYTTTSTSRAQQAAAAADIIAHSSYNPNNTNTNTNTTNSTHNIHHKSTQQTSTIAHTNNTSNNMIGSQAHLGLHRINTMELLKETVDEEEQKDLEELYVLWDEAIALYEQEEFPGDYEQLNTTAENWYVYRELISKRLEIIFNMLEEQASMLEGLVDGEVVEEGGENEEEEEDKGKGGGDVETGNGTNGTNGNNGKEFDSWYGNPHQSGGKLVDEEEATRFAYLRNYNNTSNNTNTTANTAASKYQQLQQNRAQYLASLQSSQSPNTNATTSTNTNNNTNNNNNKIAEEAEGQEEEEEGEEVVQTGVKGLLSDDEGDNDGNGNGGVKGLLSDDEEEEEDEDEGDESQQLLLSRTQRNKKKTTSLSSNNKKKKKKPQEEEEAVMNPLKKHL